MYGQQSNLGGELNPEKLQELRDNAKWSINYGAQKEFDSANKYSKRTMVLAEELQNEDLMGYARTTRALALYWQVKVEDAKVLLNENLAKVILDDSIKMETLAVLSEITMYEKLYKDALPYMITQEKIIRKNGITSERDSTKLSRIYLGMGNLHQQTENYARAHYYYDEALAYNVREGAVGYIMYYKAGLFEDENKLQESIAVTKQALKRGIQNKDDLFLPTYYLSLSTIYGKMNQADSAIYFGKKGLVDNEDCQLDQLLAAVGNGYAQKQDYKQSVTYLTKALDHSVTKTFELSAHEDLRDAYLELKQYEKAFEHNKAYLSLKDSLDNLKVKQEIVAITEKYESNKKQLEIEQLNSKNLQSTHVIKEQRSQLILISLALLLAIVVLGSIFYFYLQQKKQRQLLFEKNLQLAKELKLRDHKTNPINSTMVKEKQETTGLIDDKQRNKIHGSIEQLIVDEFYLDREMSLSKMSKILETNTTYLSKIINEDYQKTFATFINELRLSHTLRNLETEPNYRKLTIDHIAYNSGFASSSTFYNAFKKFTGLTPSYYIKKRLLQDS